jgi:ketosteroid isomerase-like protein
MSNQNSEIAQVRQTLQRFQDGYTRRDSSYLDEFMRLFVDSDELEVIGTNGVKPGLEEWLLGMEGVRDLIQSDWQFWGDVQLDVDGARIHVRRDVAWLATSGTVTTTLPADEGYQDFLEHAKGIIDREGMSPEEKLLYILRGGTNTVYELHRGEEFVWALRFTAVLVKQGGGWKFHQAQYSFPTIYLPDVRFDGHAL